MELTRPQKKEIYKNGYVVLRDLIPQKKINVSLRAINHSVGQGMNKEDIKEFRSLSFCPELLGQASILDLLYETPVWSAAESLIGKSKVQLWGKGQIALRFPVMETPGKMYPHIDGMYSPGNKVQQGTLGTFTMLAGILLSDTPNQYWGNFTVWPESHKFLELYFRKHGADSIKDQLPPLKDEDANQIIGKAGDVILCHYQLAHTVAINVSPYIRYAVFFRLKHTEHAVHKEKVLTDLWLEWPGIREII
jgi:ectoine hydroxylase-related dioxygenase (phytanoyl-CoA dioxygenase family)